MPAEPSTGIAFESAAGRWLLAVAVAGSGMAFLDGTVVNVALPDIGRDLDASDQRPAVDPQRLPADPRLADPARRLARRPLRAPARLRPRRRRLHRRLAALRGRAQRRAADRRPAAAGDRRRAADARQPGDDRGQLPARRPRPRDRRLVGPGRRRDRARAAARRLPDRGGLLAGDLPDQPADRRLRRLGGDQARARDPRPDGRAAASTYAAPRWPRSASPAPPTR